MEKLGTKTTIRIHGEEKELIAVSITIGKNKTTGLDVADTVYIEGAEHGYAFHYFGECNSYTVATLENEAVIELDKLMETRSKLQPADIVRLNLKRFPINCVVRLYNTVRKLKVADDRYKAFMNENCTFDVKGQTYYFNPRGTITDTEEKLLLFKGIDKNGTYYLYGDSNDKTHVGYIPCVSVKNANYKHYATLLDANASYIKDMLNSKVNNLDFSHFYEVISGLKKFDTCKCPKLLEKFTCFI